MKLNENTVKQIVIKVYEDLRLDHSKKYSLNVRFIPEKETILDIQNYWLGSYHYNQPIGDDMFNEYGKYIITISDDSGLAISLSGDGGVGNRYLHFENGKYRLGEKLFSMKK
jgi:hypothetical protein